MRATDSGVLTFGLVTVPVKFYTAAKTNKVEFKMLTPKGNPIKQVLTDSVTGEGVSRGDCIKGYEYSKKPSMYVQFSKEELDLLAPEKSKAVEIVEFVKADECLEVTPRTVRLRKVTLSQLERSRSRSDRRHASRRVRPGRMAPQSSR